MVPLSVPDARHLAASAHISGYRNSAGQFNAKSSEILPKPSVLFSELFDLRLHSRLWNGPRRLGPGVSAYSERQGGDNHLTHSAAFRTVARRRERRLNRLMLRMRRKIDHVTAKESEPPVHEFRGWVFFKTPQKCFSVYERRIGGTVARCQPLPEPLELFGRAVSGYGYRPASGRTSHRCHRSSRMGGPSPRTSHLAPEHDSRNVSE